MFGVLLWPPLVVSMSALLMTIRVFVGSTFLNTDLMSSKIFMLFRIMLNAFSTPKLRLFGRIGVGNIISFTAIFSAPASLTKCHVPIPPSKTVLPSASIVI
jgi:hypothetical protein